MRYRKLDANGDYTFGHGQLDFYRDAPETVAQAVLTRLRLWAGEWFLDFTDGTPYQAGVLGKHSETEANIVMRERILDTQGVLSLISFSSSLNRDTRQYQIAATIDTVYGTTKLNEIL